jgi:dipeptidase D
VCSVPGNRADSFGAALGAAAATVHSAYAKTDPGLTVGTAEAPVALDAWTADATAELLDLMTVLPSGPLALSPDFAGLVETSTSIGAAVTEGSALVVHHLTRSSNDGAAPAVLATLEAAARLSGGTFEVGQSDPGWEPDLDSPALAATRGVCERRFGGPPAVTAVHAWLETAAIGRRVPGLDMVSFGPQVEAPHSPDERVSTPTVERFWRLLAGVVDELSTA